MPEADNANNAPADDTDDGYLDLPQGWGVVLRGRDGSALRLGVFVERGESRAFRAYVADFPGLANVCGDADDVPSALFDAVARVAERSGWMLARVLEPGEPVAEAPARSRWADTDALGPTIKAWCARRGSDRVGDEAAKASDRELCEALQDYRLAQCERDGVDRRVADVLREADLRLWRANGGAPTADERDRATHELLLASVEHDPELRAGEAARYWARWGREPCLSDCACPECVPLAAEVERLKAEAAALRAAVGELFAAAWAARLATLMHVAGEKPGDAATEAAMLAAERRARSAREALRALAPEETDV